MAVLPKITQGLVQRPKSAIFSFSACGRMDGFVEGTAIGIRCTPLWNYVELFWNSLDNAPSSIVFYSEMKVEVEVGVHDIRSWFTPR